MSRSSNTTERRSEIVAALIQVMAKNGFDGASTSAIAESAGLTPGLVHYHFKSKLEILLAAIDTIDDEHSSALLAHVEKGRTPTSRLHRYVDFHLATGKSSKPERLACWLLITGESLRERKVRSAVARVLTKQRELLCQILEEGRTQGVFHHSSTEASAAAILSTIQGYFVLAATHRTLIPSGSAARSTKAMCAGLLRLSES